jgi:sporulation protein YlmC with PRC-barrel domain
VGYWPYYGLGMGGMGMGGMGVGGMSGGLSGIGGGNIAQIVTDDIVPQGEVGVRRGEQVHATDGDIGRVQGLVIDRSSRHVTHVLLQEGHLWGRREVAIPTSAVASTGDGIRLRISKQEVQDLPPVDVNHPER